MTKTHLLILAGLFLFASNAFGQLTPAQPTQYTQEQVNSIAQQIAADAKRMQMERWKILQETQTKIFEIQQDVTVNKSKTADLKLKEFDKYIRGSADPEVKSPSIQSSGRITVGTATGVTPSANEVPNVNFSMQVLLFRNSDVNFATDTPIWQSNVLTATATGFGTFDYNLSFSDPSFDQFLSNTDQLGVETIFDESFDTTSVTSDDVLVSLGTGMDPYAELPETGFSFTLVPEPAGVGMVGMAWILARRRRRGARDRLDSAVSAEIASCL